MWALCRYVGTATPPLFTNKRMIVRGQRGLRFASDPGILLVSAMGMPMRNAERFVSYLRVSTSQQGRSGLGLDAQRVAIERFLSVGDTVIGEFIEVETGKGYNALDRRPQLQAAVALCRKTKAQLLIAKLDRLARNVRFFLELMDSGIGVVFCDVPETRGATGRFLLTNLAAVAELEAGLISERTRAALAAAKARGTRLGNPRMLADPVGFAQAREEVFRQRHLEGIDLEAVVASLHADGVTTLRAISAKLNADGVPSPRGGKWHPSTVHRLLKRLEAPTSS